MNVLREQIYLAALLHDIGKFYQRADDAGAAQSKQLSEQTKKLESIICPKSGQGYSHKHVLWTAQFLYNYEIHIRNLLKKSGIDEELTFIKLAASHHNPDKGSVAGIIVQKADHYSSGVDRTKESGEKDANDEGGWDNFKKKRMRSVFEALFSKNPEYKFQLPVEMIDLDKSYFPQEQFTQPPDYKSLWEAFDREVKFIQSGNFRTFAENLLNLMEKYTSTIPSSTMHLPDVSLYDHSKTTAAFAVCLHDYLYEKNGLKNWDIRPDEQAFLLIGADVSGIQNFIYDIVSKNAAKNLKGRSFYLQLLVDSILQKLLNELKLFNANIVYASGGGFYLIAPNTKEVVKALEQFEDEISEKIFDTHQNRLFLAIDYVGFSENDLFRQSIHQPWQKLIDKLDKKKQQRNLKLLVNRYDDFFEPTDIGGDQIRDSITGEEIANKRQIVYLKTDGGIQEQPVHEITYQQIELGQQLKSSDYWVSSDIELKYWSDKSFDPCGIGIYHYFLSKKVIEKSRNNLKSSADRVRIYTVNDLNFLETVISGAENIYGFNFYGGNKFPTEEDEYGKDFPKTFDRLAGDEDTELKRLGILRMDVDNLGQAFISGFSDNKKTFSRYSSLSRSLDYFFRGYLNTIYKKPKFSDHTFIIYSGGDDLFIVGKWSLLADMAYEIYNDFRHWTCNNPQLGISGGLAIVTPKFPIMKGAMLSDETEKKAKTHEINNLKKNSITLFDFPLNWELEYPVVKDLKDRMLVLLATKEGLPSGFLQRIFNFYENYREQNKEQDKKQKNPRWRWMIAYDFSRLKGRIKNDEAKSFIEELKQDLFADIYKGTRLQSGYHFIELLTVAARWAELERKS